jgi:hypothetical protein
MAMLEQAARVIVNAYMDFRAAIMSNPNMDTKAKDKLVRMIDDLEDALEDADDV